MDEQNKNNDHDENNKEYDIAIVGAGIAGLYTVFRVLHEAPKTRIIVLEADTKPGGRIQMADFAGSQVVCGAGIGRTTDVLMHKLHHALGFKPEPSFPFRAHYSPILETIDLKATILKLRQAYRKDDHGEKARRQGKTFQQFATPILGGPQEYQKLVNTVGYHDFDTEDIYDLLYNYGLDVFGERQLRRVPWHRLVEKLVRLANKGHRRIHFGQQVERIEKNEKKTNAPNVLHILCNKHHRRYVIHAKKVVVGTAIQAINHLVTPLLQSENKDPRLYRSVDGQFAKKSASIMQQIVTAQTLVPGDIQKVIPWSPESGIYMISYCDNAAAARLVKRTKNTPENRAFFCRELEKGLHIEQGLLHLKQIRAFYWAQGTHCYTPISGGESVAHYIHRIQRPVANVYTVGEAVSDNHGWCEGALQSVENIITEIRS